jgi:hypothetical protein
MSRDTTETLWSRLSRSWQQPRLTPHLAEDTGLPAERPRRVLNPLVGAFLR